MCWDYYLEKLENVVTAQEVSLTETCMEMKDALLKLIERDYKKMHKSNIHFRDLHMSNILVDKEAMKIYWVDSSLSRIAKIF